MRIISSASTDKLEQFQCVKLINDRPSKNYAKNAISVERRVFTWSPTTGISPEPSRRSRAFTPPEPGISANLGAAAEAAAVRRMEAVATAARSCRLVRVGGGVVAAVTALAFRGGGTAPANAATAVVTIGGCYLQSASLLFPFYTTVLLIFTLIFLFSFLFRYIYIFLILFL
jgi:hypothetical protein